MVRLSCLLMVHRREANGEVTVRQRSNQGSDGEARL